MEILSVQVSCGSANPGLGSGCGVSTARGLISPIVTRAFAGGERLEASHSTNANVLRMFLEGMILIERFTLVIQYRRFTS